MVPMRSPAALRIGARLSWKVRPPSASGTLRTWARPSSAAASKAGTSPKISSVLPTTAPAANSGSSAWIAASEADSRPVRAWLA